MGAAGDLAGNVAIVTGAASASPFLGRACLTHYAASNATIVNLTKSPSGAHERPGAHQRGRAGRHQHRDHRVIQRARRRLGRYLPLRGAAGPEELTELILMLAGPRGTPFHDACLDADRGITAG